MPSVAEEVTTPIAAPLSAVALTSAPATGTPVPTTVTLPSTSTGLKQTGLARPTDRSHTSPLAHTEGGQLAFLHSPTGDEREGEHPVESSHGFSSYFETGSMAVSFGSFARRFSTIHTSSTPSS